MAWLKLVDVSVALGKRDVIHGVSVDVGPGELVVIVGPNGAGKTTLLRAIAGLVQPRTGTVRVMGHDPSRVARRAIARDLAYLPQQYELLAFPFAVEEVVLLGRYANQRGFGLATPADLAAARDAMVACDVIELAARRFDELSGGEARRVIIAQAMCQGARCLLLDEPTAGLDPAHARAVFGMLRAHCDAGATAVVVTHDLDLALRHGGTMWLIASGRLAARGTPADVLGAGSTREAFGLAIHVGALPFGLAVRGARVSGFVSAASARLTRRRMLVALGACALACVLVAVIAPLLGVASDRTGRHLEVLGFGAFDVGSSDHVILWVRIPRVLASLLVGGALAGAGCALQALLRNPLAEPFTLGISSGAALAAVIAIRVGIEGALGGAGVGAAALLGALATLSIVWRLARIGRQLPPATLVLAGVTLSMFCSAASVLIQYTSDFSEVSRMLRWMMGGLDSMRLPAVGYATGPILGGLAVLMLYGRELNALAAGPEAAASVGVAVARTQAMVFVVASLLVGTAIALAGPIGFIGLIVPHALRAVIGSDHRVLLPASVFGGAVLLTVCDTLARTITAPAQLPTGALTAVLGGPFFVLILVGQKRKAALWGRA